MRAALYPVSGSLRFAPDNLPLPECVGASRRCHQTLPGKRLHPETADPGQQKMTAKPAKIMSTKDPTPPGAFGSGTAAPSGEFTGRTLVLLAEKSGTEMAKFLKKTAGLKNLTNVADAKGSDFNVESIGPSGGVVFEKIGAAVVDADPDQIQSLSVAAAEERSEIVAVEPERFVYSFTAEYLGSEGQGASLTYVQGFRDGVNQLAARVLNGQGSPEAEEIEAQAWNETLVTWGLQACRVPPSRFSGRGVRVAVLDTGMDLRHPDFAGRQIVAKSFVPNQPPQDGHGHGTHCIGTACGPQRPPILPRYGIGYGTAIFAGKVLSNQGSGSDAGILAGINWAVANKCQVISMSLGASLSSCVPFNTVYEGVAARALRAGSLIVAAAGNDSRRPGLIRPVSHPANCPSIMAVGALDENLRVAPFSNGGVCGNVGGKIDIAAPGVNVYSTAPMPRRYARMAGTSMATPHVAGCAALHCEATRATGAALWRVLTSTARPLTLPSRDVGAGLVQAP